MLLSRRLRLGVLGLSLVAFAVSVWIATASFKRLNEARQQSKDLRLELEHLRSLLPTIEQREAYARRVIAMSAQLEELVENPANWSQRRIQRSSSLVSRYEAENVLVQLSGDESPQWFVPESFSVSVASPLGGLFTPAAADDMGFNLEYSGLIYFPVEPQ